MVNTNDTADRLLNTVLFESDEKRKEEPEKMDMELVYSPLTLIHVLFPCKP
jgi:hypothetical protein